MRNCMNIYIRAFVLLFVLTFASCVSTKEILTENEILYTGVKEVEIIKPKKLKLSSEEQSRIDEICNIPPNNVLYSPSIRSPFPFGLWVNTWNIKKEKGFKYWMYKKFAKKPITIESINPELRTKMVEVAMQDYGFFNTDCSYEMIYNKKDKQKAKLKYKIILNEPYKLGDIEIYDWDENMSEIVNNYLSKMSSLKSSANYDINILQQERENIAGRLRNNAYYYFQPEYIEYMADTTYRKDTVDLRVALKKNIPENVFKKFKIAAVTVDLRKTNSIYKTDSIIYDGIKIIYDGSEQLKPFVISKAIISRPGTWYSQRRQDRAYENLVGLGVFDYVNLNHRQINKNDSVQLETYIRAEYAKPANVEFEVGVASKSNNLLGPGLLLTFNDKNYFKRAYDFSLKMNFSYEWQIGSSKEQKQDKSLLNSYEMGLSANLAIPKLLLPKFMMPKNDNYDKTTLQIGANLLNRHSFFRMLSVWTSATYEYSLNRRKTHTIVPLKLNYTYLLKTSEKFDSTIIVNPMVAQSFKNQFIPSASYTYTYDKKASYRNPNRIFWRTTISEAGNLLSALKMISVRISVTGPKSCLGMNILNLSR